MAQPQTTRLEEELDPEQLELRQILHDLWWEVRQSNLARLQASVLGDEEMSA